MTYILALAKSLFVAAVLIGPVDGKRQREVTVQLDQNQTTREDEYCVQCGTQGKQIRVVRPCKADEAWRLGMVGALAPYGLVDATTYLMWLAGGPLVGVGATIALKSVAAVAAVKTVNDVAKNIDKQCLDLKFYFKEEENFLAIDMVANSKLSADEKINLQEACLNGFKEAKQDVPNVEKFNQCMQHKWLCGSNDPPALDVNTCTVKRDDTVRVYDKDIIKEGTLTKESEGVGGKLKRLKARHMVLTRTHLYSFKNNDDLKNPTEKLRVSAISEVKPVQPADTGDDSGNGNQFQVVTPKRTFSLAADTQSDQKEWIEVIGQHMIQETPSE